MVYNTPNKASDGDNTSSVNIQYNWACEVSSRLHCINNLNSQCGQGNYSILNQLFSELNTLIYFLGPTITRTGIINQDKTLQKSINEWMLEIRKDILRFNNRKNNNEKKMKREGMKIYLKILELHDLLMEELNHHEILRYIKMNVKDMARQQWYGDVD